MFIRVVAVMSLDFLNPYAQRNSQKKDNECKTICASNKLRAWKSFAAPSN